MDKQDDVTAPVETVSSAVAAENKILRELLALAREIRRPWSYIGYSSFVLMALYMGARPCVWEGGTLIDLIATSAPWALERCTAECAVQAVCCVVVAQLDGSARLMPISDEHPLSECRHFVACARLPHAAVADASECLTEFERLYSSLGVVALGTVVDGDCGIDVMTLMLSRPSSLEARKQLRVDLSDYLISRASEAWMRDLMVACGELRTEDVSLARSSAPMPPAPPVAPAAAVAEKDAPETAIVVASANKPDEEDEGAFEAVRWASKLTDDVSVFSLMRALPPEIVREQVVLHLAREAESAVAVPAPGRCRVGNTRFHKVRMIVGEAFHDFCLDRDVDPEEATRLPRGFGKEFLSTLKLRGRQITPLTLTNVQRWHKTWIKSHRTDQPSSKRQRGLQRLTWNTRRCRGRGGGRQPKAHLVRQELYEWWSGLRHAIDWKELARRRRSRGKKHLARFPRCVLRIKVQQLMEDLAYASLMNGEAVQSFVPNSHWFRRWESDYGLNMKKANRKYQVPRAVVKERLEIFWVNLFRVRYLIKLIFGYDPVIENSDQSPYHHNETGAQNKPLLALQGDLVPVVEGHSDTFSRWTANLTTRSEFSEARIPYCELMFKAEGEGRVYVRLQAFLRSRGFPPWMSVTTAPKGSYREQDVIALMERHLEPWTDDREWRIYLLDDYAAHKTNNVNNMAWGRGYVHMTHGGGTTPIAQTPDTDLNEETRQRYTTKESQLLIEKMRDGDSVPKATCEESMQMMLDVLSDPELHRRASQGYKKTGQSIDLHGTEDGLICREAGQFWNETTTGGHANMRALIDAELAAVAEEVASGGLQWHRRDVARLIAPYPTRKQADEILARLGDDSGRDGVHGAIEDVVVEGEASSDSSSEESAVAGHTGSDEAAAVAGGPGTLAEVDTAVAGDGVASLLAGEAMTPTLSAEMAEQVHGVKVTIAALEESIETLRDAGALKAAQCVQGELAKERRRERNLVKESPAIADAFQKRRQAEMQDTMRRRRFIEEQNQRDLAAKRSIEERNAAVAELKKRKKEIQDCENLIEIKHAMKTFTVESLGQGSSNGGGARGRTRRFEVLDRIARLGAGLSAPQKNDWVWFKDSWDLEMVREHAADWGSLFAGWMQAVLENKDSNAFSVFVHNETCRIFHASAALRVP